VDVTAEPEPGTESTGLVSYRRRHYGAQEFCWEIGFALLPKWRGQGIGWRAQAIFFSYLFENTPVQRIEAATHAENTAEQRSLGKPGSPSKASSARPSTERANGATATSTTASAPTLTPARARPTPADIVGHQLEKAVTGPGTAAQRQPPIRRI
jgi:GNAT superfamily N-acetyltransferase